jgi:hypothetical protein
MVQHSFYDVLEKAFAEQQTITVHLKKGYRFHGKLLYITEKEGALQETDTDHDPDQPVKPVHFAPRNVRALTLVL